MRRPELGINWARQKKFEIIFYFGRGLLQVNFWTGYRYYQQNKQADQREQPATVRNYQQS